MSYWNVKNPYVSYFHIFGSIYYILNYREHLGKFDAKSDTSVFLGYSTNQSMLLLIILVIFLSFQMKKLSLV